MSSEGTAVLGVHRLSQQGWPFKHRRLPRWRLLRSRPSSSTSAVGERRPDRSFDRTPTLLPSGVPTPLLPLLNMQVSLGSGRVVLDDRALVGDSIFQSRRGAGSAAASSMVVLAMVLTVENAELDSEVVEDDAVAYQ